MLSSVWARAPRAALQASSPDCSHAPLALARRRQVATTGVTVNAVCPGYVMVRGSSQLGQQ